MGRMRKENNQKLQNEYEKLVAGLREQLQAREEDMFLTNPVLPADVLEGAVPGTIRKAEHFVAFLKRFCEYLKVCLSETILLIY